MKGIKFNNKGMAISGILYTILVLFIVLLFGILSLLSSSKYTFDKIKIDVVEKIDGTEAEGVTSNECFDFDYSTGTITSYHSESPICSTDVVIPQSIAGVLVKKIAAKAFYSKEITSVDFTNAVYLESIEDGTKTTGAFALNEIKEVKFGKNMYLENIGKFAFFNTGITGDLDLSTLISLKTIGEAAFYTNSISSVDFTNLYNLTTIGYGAFYGNVISGKLDFSSLSSLTTIDSFAFSRNNISSIDTTNMISLTKISSYAFDDNQIESFNFKNLTALRTLGGRSFSFNKLTSVDLSNCTKIDSIGNYTFVYNEITSVKIYNTIRSIGEYSFARNKISGVLDLSNISPTNFGKYAFYNNQITGLKYGGATISEGVFASNKITSLDFNNIPNVTIISPLSFYMNDTLTTVNFRNKPITDIGDMAFSNCAITALTIPSTVSSIGNSAFANNQIASAIDLSANSNLSIGDLAFYNNKITDITLPTIMKSIGGGAFNLNNVTNDAKKNVYARNEDGTENTSLIISYAGAGDGTIIIEDEVTGIDSYAFQSINAEDIVFGANVETIDDYAFAGFKISGALNLSRMTNLKTIGKYAFASNSYSKTITYSETIADTSTTNNNVSYKYKKFNTVTVTSNKKNEVTGITSINFSGLVNLETIDEYAFYNNNSLTGLSGLEDLVSLSNVGKYAFDNNYFQTDINLSNTKLTTINDSSFSSIKSKAGSAYGKLTLPDSVTHISGNAFRYIRLAEVELSENLIHIGSYAFSGNKFTSLNLPDSVEEIGASAFIGNSLTEIILPASLKKMGNSVFQGVSVRKADFSKTGPDFVTIPTLAFHSSAPLSEVILSDYIKNIETSSFSFCNIKDIVIPASVDYIARGAFSNNHSTWNSITILSNETNLDTRFDNDWEKIGWPYRLKPAYDSSSYSLSTTEVNNLEFIGKPYEITIPKTGKYKLEVWGAQGGNYSEKYIGGKGGYSVGEINLTEGETLYVFVGGTSISTNRGYLTDGTFSFKRILGGFNGGGYGFVQTAEKYYLGGGGATDIRIGSQSKYARVIVAGGGSGASLYASGNAGGGTNGIGYSGYIGKQTEAGAAAGFGYSANTAVAYNSVIKTTGGAGGGWYGGGAQTDGSGGNKDTAIKMHGGGSGYVYTSSTAANYPSGCLLTSTYYLSNAKTIAGNASMPSHSSSGNMTGNTGDGYARITYIG